MYPSSIEAAADISLGKSLLCLEPAVQLNKSFPLPYAWSAGCDVFYSSLQPWSPGFLSGGGLMGLNLFSWPPGLLTSQDPEPYPAHSGDDENLVIWVPFSHKGCPYHGKVNLKSVPWGSGVG